MSKVVVENITKQADDLSLSEHIELIEMLVHRLRDKSGTMPKPLDWEELYGLGKGLWADEDAQEYVNRLREDRL
jgi:hypothetical protein